jgi:hypothetical protein
MDEVPKSKNRVSTRLGRRTIPLFLSALGLWAMAGCFYLPLPEHRADKKQTDFRELVGAPESKRPLRPGVATRESVTAALGPPQWVSRDRRSVAYTLETVRAVWVYPVCFATQVASQRIYSVRLVFDDNNVLASWALVHVDQGLDWFKGVPIPAERAIEKLNRGATDNATIEPAAKH